MEAIKKTIVNWVKHKIFMPDVRECITESKKTRQELESYISKNYGEWRGLFEKARNGKGRPL